MSSTQNIGALGERQAMGYLISNGFNILHTNWRNGRYEIDIVAQKRGVIHIVEVKCRKADGLTSPEEAITPKKFEALKKAAQYYVALYKIDFDIQFDLVAVEHSAEGFQIRYIPNAMVCSW